MSLLVALTVTITALSHTPTAIAKQSNQPEDQQSQSKNSDCDWIDESGDCIVIVEGNATTQQRQSQRSDPTETPKASGDKEHHSDHSSDQQSDRSEEYPTTHIDREQVEKQPVKEQSSDCKDELAASQAAKTEWEQSKQELDAVQRQLRQLQQELFLHGVGSFHYDYDLSSYPQRKLPVGWGWEPLTETKVSEKQRSVINLLGQKLLELLTLKGQLEEQVETLHVRYSSYANDSQACINRLSKAFT